MTVPVLMLQTFSGERGSSGDTAQHKTFRHHVAGGPYQVADALDSKHRVKQVKRNRIDSVGCVSGSRGNKG